MVLSDVKLNLLRCETCYDLLSFIDLFHIISFVQFKTMLMSLWGDEGIQTAFQRFAKSFPYLGISRTNEFFVVLFYCIFDSLQLYFLRNSASSIQKLSSSIFPCSFVRTSRIGNISIYLHYMMF